MGVYKMPPKNKKKNEITFSNDSDNDSDEKSDTDMILDSKKTKTSKEKNKVKVELNVKDISTSENNKKQRKKYSGKELGDLISEKEISVSEKKDRFLSDQKNFYEQQKKLRDLEATLKKSQTIFFKEQEELFKLLDKSNKERLIYVDKKIEKSNKAKKNKQGFMMEKTWPKEICELIECDPKSEMNFIEVKPKLFDSIIKKVGSESNGKFINTSKDNKLLKLFGINKGEKVDKRFFAQKLKYAV